MAAKRSLYSPSGITLLLPIVEYCAETLNKTFYRDPEESIFLKTHCIASNSWFRAILVFFFLIQSLSEPKKSCSDFKILNMKPFMFVSSTKLFNMVEWKGISRNAYSYLNATPGKAILVKC